MDVVKVMVLPPELLLKVKSGAKIRNRRQKERVKKACSSLEGKSNGGERGKNVC